MGLGARGSRGRLGAAAQGPVQRSADVAATVAVRGTSTSREISR
jgi:hypothetical protein